MTAIALAGRRALVTGGASGIGLAVVRGLAAAGASVVVADIDAAGAAAAARQVAGAHEVLDVTDSGAWAALADRLAVDGLDLAVLNAGVLTGEARLDALTDAALARALSVNVTGVVFGLRALAPLMVRQGGGAVTVTASLAGLIGWDVDPVYSMTKHALVGFVRSIAPQLAADGVRVSLVCPGITDTPLIPDAMRGALTASGFPTLAAEQVAAAHLQALTGGEPGQALVCQPGRAPTPFRFANVPGPVVDGAGGVRPPQDLHT